MLRTLTAALAAGFVATVALANDFDGHKAVRVRVDTDAELQDLLGLTDDVWSHRIGVGGWVDVRLSPEAYEAMLDLGLAHEVLLEDVGAAIDAERLEIQQRNLLAGLDFFENYRTADEILAYVEDLGADHPGLVTFSSAGTSVEGRDIWAVSITGPGDPADRVDVGVTGTQHAREWVSPMTVTYLIDRLITQYGTDDRITTLMDNVEFHIVPIVNPDGYVYSWADPDNRLWRKNRRDNGICYGVDLNRNWGYEWGGEGASGNQCNDTYRGPDPLSEPETADVAAFLDSLENLAGHIDFHSYGQLILSPWGYTNDLPGEATLFDQLNAELQEAIYDVHEAYYVAGPSYTTIYPASGVIPDYVFGALNAWSWTIELRPNGQGGGGFLLPPDQILPTAEENLPALLTLAENTLEPVKIVSAGLDLPSFIPADEALPVSIDVYEVMDSVAADGATLQYRASQDDAFQGVPLTPDGFAYAGELPSQTCGETVELFFQVETAGGQTLTYPEGGADAPIALDVLEQFIIVEDDAETDTGWTVGAAGDDAETGIWERADPEGTDAQPEDDHTPDGTDCWITGADAGDGLGANDIDGGVTTLTSPVFSAVSDDVEGDPHLVYWRWYSNDTGNAPNSDSMPVHVSNDGGATWTLLEEVTENAGAWVEASFRISDYVEPTDQMRLRFAASDLGDGSIVEAGVDDLRVEILDCDCPSGADFNADGQLSVLDFVAFQEAWTGGDPCADLNADGEFSILDFVAFQDLFQDG